MNQVKCGALIRELRRERGMTQRALAESIGVGDKAVSKWERGLGCPDVSLLGALSRAFGVKIENLLEGSLEPNRADGGNMKKVKFYACPQCGSLLTSTGTPEISCCGRRLEPLAPAPADGAHQPRVEWTDGEYYVTLPHEMSKEHFIGFVAYATYDRVLFIRLYPEQDAAFRMPAMRGGSLYLYCSRHGLMQADIGR